MTAHNIEASSATPDTTGWTPSEIDRLFVDAIKTGAKMRRRLMEEMSAEESALHKLAGQMGVELLQRLLRGAALATTLYATNEGRAILCAVEIIMDLCDDPEMVEIMAKRIEGHERHLARADKEARAVTTEEHQMLQRVAKAELRKILHVSRNRAAQ